MRCSYFRKLPFGSRQFGILGLRFRVWGVGSQILKTELRRTLSLNDTKRGRNL